MPWFLRMTQQAQTGEIARLIGSPAAEWLDMVGMQVVAIAAARLPSTTLAGPAVPFAYLATQTLPVGTIVCLSRKARV